MLNCKSSSLQLRQGGDVALQKYGCKAPQSTFVHRQILLQFCSREIHHAFMNREIPLRPGIRNATVGLYLKCLD